MAFGGFFGGGSSSSSSSHNNNDNDKHNNHENNNIPTAPMGGAGAQAIFPPSIPSSNASSAEIKSRLTTAISTQSNILNAKILIQKINENCFDHCVPAPGSSLSRNENQCLSACMEKYIDAWNTVSRTYVTRLQREGAQLGMGGGGAF